MYYSTSLVLNSRVLLMYTDTVKDLPGYPVQNSPSGSFLYWGGSVGRGGIVYDIVGMGCPEGNPGKCAYTCMLSYSIVSLTSISIFCLLLLYSIYLCGPSRRHTVPSVGNFLNFYTWFKLVVLNHCTQKLFSNTYYQVGFCTELIHLGNTNNSGLTSNTYCKTVQYYCLFNNSPIACSYPATPFPL